MTSMRRLAAKSMETVTMQFFIQMILMARLANNKGGLLHMFTSTGCVVMIIRSLSPSQRNVFCFFLRCADEGIYMVRR